MGTIGSSPTAGVYSFHLSSHGTVTTEQGEGLEEKVFERVAISFQN